MMDFKSIRKIAKEKKWVEIPLTDQYMVSFHKIIDSCPARINVWIGKKGITIGTYLNHPKKGKTSLFRKHATEGLIKKIFKNPRVHTGVGYSRK